MTRLGQILLALGLAPQLACASLQGFADKAEDARREVAGTLLALQAVLDECEAMQQPKPAICEQAAKLEAELQAWGAP